MPAPLPETDAAPLVRTDFTDGQAWVALQEALDVEWDVADDYVSFVDEPEYRGLSAAQLAALVPAGCPHPVLLVADDVTFASDDLPVLLVDLAGLVDGPDRTFRAPAGAIDSIIANLADGTTSFADHVRSVDATGAYRPIPRRIPASKDPRARIPGPGRIGARVARPAQRAQPGAQAIPGQPVRKKPPSE